MNKISDDIIWRYLQGTATTEDMKALNEYISASPENKKYLFSIEELYHLGKWKYDEEEKNKRSHATTEIGSAACRGIYVFA